MITSNLVNINHVIFEENTFLLTNSNVPTTVGYNFLDNDTPFLPSQTYTTPP